MEIKKVVEVIGEFNGKSLGMCDYWEVYNMGSIHTLITR